ncbi:MAG TPA: DUF4234 domain-containing protein [Kofleriaceae bacterium]|nr:DUF4234 domain-containing protein [Kofleriaceae bacterium]
MRTRSAPLVFLFGLITFGIYTLYWMVSTKNELNQRGAAIPTAWLLIVPIANIWWMWKYGEGAERATGGKVSGAVAFLLLFLLGTIGMAVVQSMYNSLPAAGQAQMPQARVA